MEPVMHCRAVEERKMKQKQQLVVVGDRAEEGARLLGTVETLPPPLARLFLFMVAGHRVATVATVTSGTSEGAQSALPVAPPTPGVGWPPASANARPLTARSSLADIHAGSGSASVAARGCLVSQVVSVPDYQVGQFSVDRGEGMDRVVWSPSLFLWQIIEERQRVDNTYPPEVVYEQEGSPVVPDLSQAPAEVGVEVYLGPVGHMCAVGAAALLHVSRDRSDHQDRAVTRGR